MKRDWLSSLLIVSCYIIAIPFTFSAVTMIFYTHNPIHVQIATNHAIVAVGLVVVAKFLALMSVAHRACTIYVERHCPKEKDEANLGA